ncbi:transcription termination/antitermination protein NusG [Candidatus Parcubacteria bacterium]|nr:transcription termination/antitermination protein NusG [Candidatus Parcubacteria bacterium]
MTTEKALKNEWYVIHTFSGHENKVASALKQRIDASGLTDQVGEILVPTRNKVVISGGKKKTVAEKLFPGYILINMAMNDESWLVIKSTTGVTGFVGTGDDPSPLPKKEVDSILKFMEMGPSKFEAQFKVGDAIRIAEGPFTDFVGKVDEINEERGKVKALVSVFGRETPIELDFVQVNPL